jgi:hypothetical protein
MLSKANVKAAGPNCAKLHPYVMEHSKDKLAFPEKVDQDYFKGGCGALMLNIEFSSVFNLINIESSFSGCYLHEVMDIVSPLKPKKIFI